MSQRKEKYARDLERRLEALEGAVRDIPRQVAALTKQGPDLERRLHVTRRRAARAERAAAAWKAAACGALLAAIAVLTVAILAVQTEARATGIPQGEPQEAAGAPPVVRVLALPDAAALNREAQRLPWANKIEDCVVTYYDVCDICCGKTDGVTASGVPAAPYETCAVDPGVIPLGSAVIIDYGGGELHYYRAEDTGVQGAHVDVCVSSHEEAARLGRMEADVYWI